MPFGQVVVGPPGSGKTTYCNGMQQFLKAIQRNTIIVNLDPANDNIPYECTIDIRELVSLPKVMEEENLGPNGALVYCIEYLEVNFDWLYEKLQQYKDSYVIFDCPGQVELYTHHDSMQNILKALDDKHYRITAVHLVDSFYCSNPTTFISVLLTSLITMLRLSLPHINVLSKIDLITSMGKLDFSLEFYTDVLDLNYLLDTLDKDPFAKKYHNLNEQICGLVEDFGLVAFNTLDIQNKESVFNLLKEIDKCNGYVFGGLTPANESIFMVANANPHQYFRVGEIEEKYVAGLDIGEDEFDDEIISKMTRKNDQSNNNNIEEIEESK